jgi:hypothetical protein
MQTSCKLSKDDDSKSTDQRKYMSMIDSLIYVKTSILDVMQAVGQVARFQAAPKKSHVLACFSGYFNGFFFIRYIIGKEDGFFNRSENPDDIIIFHFFENSSSLQKNYSLKR